MVKKGEADAWGSHPHASASLYEGVSFLLAPFARPVASSVAVVARTPRDGPIPIWRPSPCYVATVRLLSSAMVSRAGNNRGSASGRT